MRTRLSCRISLGLLFALLLGQLAAAQNGTTSVRGVVSDPGGAVVPGASVTISNPASGYTSSATTDGQGSYRFFQLQPGTYTLTVNAKGFTPLKRENVDLLVDTPATADFKLRVSADTQVIDVTAETPIINTTDASIGNTIASKQVLNLPFEGRDPAEVLSLEPGVTFIGNRVNDNFDTRNGAVNGGRSDQANITLDGVDNNDQVGGRAFQGAVRSTLESIQEFRVTTLGANADEGRSSGGQVALVTKSGTNSFHGAVYEYHRPTITAANDWFNKKAELDAGLPNIPGKIIRNTFGAAVGGPIIKDRFFFFANYEGQRTAENEQVSRSVPGNTLRNGMISYPDVNGGVTTLNATQIASMDPNCTALGTCPLGPGVNPAVLAVFNKYPAPNSSSCNNADGFNISCFTFSAPNPNHLNTSIAKLDYNLNQSGTQRLFLRGNYQEDLSADPPQFPGQQAAVTRRNNSRGLAAGYTATISPRLLNDFHYGYTRLSLANIANVDQSFTSFRFIDDLFPTITDPNDFTRISHVPVHNWTDDMTWNKGKHTIQFGANIRLINNIRSSDATSFNEGLINPLFLSATPAGSGGSLDPAAFGFAGVDPNNASVYNNAIVDLAGIVSQVTGNYNRDKFGNVLPQGAPVNRHFRNWEYEGYIQDAYHLTPNLLVTAGLRYTFLQTPYETSGTQAAPNISLHQLVQQRGSDMLKGIADSPILGFDLDGQANGRAPYWNYNYKDFAPRFAIAYSPHAESGIFNKLFGSAGQSSIRAGFGIVYDHFGEALVDTFDQNGTFGLTTSITNAASIQTVDGGARFSGLNTIPTSSPDGILLTPAPSGGFPAIPPISDANNDFQQIAFGLDDKLHTPYSEAVDFSITRELPGGFTVETAYLGRFAHRLLQQRDLAMPLNLVDPKSKMDYFTAAQMFGKDFFAGVPTSQVAPIPYWENLFGNAAGVSPGSCLTGDPGVANPTATQAMYELYTCNIGPGTFGETNALNIADAFCFPGCLSDKNGNPLLFQYYLPQYSALYAWSSTGNSAYNAAQLILRSRQRYGLTFDFNYTYSKSIDIGSDSERVPTFGGLSAVINTWAPNQLRGPSDFDATHQINSNWVYELPFGRNKRFGSGWNTLTDTFLGGWQLSGVYRWSSGLPFSVGNGGVFPTNFQLSGEVFTNGTVPKTGTTIIGGNPFAFVQGTAAQPDFRFALAGESGQRNNFRGDGYFGVDLGLAKAFRITESQRLRLSAEAFNLTNSVRFDPQEVNANIQNQQTFGEYTTLLNQPRVMQFALRYEF